MRPISPATITNPRRRNLSTTAFTFVEVSVVITVLLLMAAVMLPRLSAVKKSRDLRSLEAKVARLPVEARNEAVKSSAPVTIRLSDTALVMERTPANGSAEQVKQIDLGSTMQVDDAQRNGQEAAPASWQWTAYPDGTSDSGGLTVIEGDQRKSLIMPKAGFPTWVTGDLPDASQDQWPAGDLLQRV